MATRIQRGATKEGTGRLDTRSARQTTGKKIEYSNRQPLDQSATQNGVTPVGLAYGEFNDSTQIVLDANFQVVGDPPKPISVSYDVDLSTSILAQSKTAHLEFTVLHGSHARVAINGHRLQIPYSGHLQVWEAAEVGATVVPVPLAYFQSGNNAVVFEAGRGFWTTANVYDDYRFGEVVLIFSH